MRRGPLLLAALVAAAACGAPQLSARPVPRSFTPGDYERVYDRWTRSGDEFSFGRLETVLHVTATFESWEFRWAYVTRYAADYGLDTGERTRLLEASLADAQERHRFFVTMAGNFFRDSDLTDRRSSWRVLLLDDDGRQVRPVELTRLRRTGAAERIYFPTVNPQRHTFRIAFPTHYDDGHEVLGTETERIRLRFTGAEGRVDLGWRFETER